MPLAASKVTTDEDVQSAHINALIEDIRTNHDHADGKGATVDHADLVDTGPMYALNHDHGDIETHMNGSTGSFSDNPGGDRGVHGLEGTGAYVAGSLGDQLVIQCGTCTLGSYYAFPTAFLQIKAILLTMIGPHTGPGVYPTEIYVDSGYTSAGFTPKCSSGAFSGNSVFYVAFGTM